MSNIGEDFDSNLEHQKSARPARFTKVATYMGILGWLFTLIYFLMRQLSPATSMFDVASEDEATFWVMVFVRGSASLIAIILMLIGLIFALVGTSRRERGGWLATGWLVPASVVPFWLVVVLLRI